MGKLCQILAVEKGTKSRVYSDITTLDKAVQKPELFNGLTRTYAPIDDTGEKLPAENKRVQFNANDILGTAGNLLTELFQIEARKDFTNCVAKADVVVDGVTLFAAAPVSFLLFLEKQLTDVKTLIGRMPTLDDSETWTLDKNTGNYKADAAQTHRTKKEQRPIVLYAATDKHPAQTQLLTEDVVVGYWTAVKQSGAVSKTDKAALLARVEKVLDTVKIARETANMTDEVEVPEIGKAIFGYILNK